MASARKTCACGKVVMALRVGKKVMQDWKPVLHEGYLHGKSYCKKQ